MGGGDLNLKKSWHPSTLRNIERVWKAEQKHEAEKQKIEQLQKELAEERAREEIQQFAEDQGVIKKKEEKLDWMYQGPAAMINREDYLLGRKIDKTFETLQLMENRGESSKDEGTDDRSVFTCQNLSGTATVDMANKIREDPLFNIMKKEKEEKKSLITNPVKMKQLQQLLEASLCNKKSKKNQKTKKKQYESDSGEEHKKHKKHQKYASLESDDNRWNQMISPERNKRNKSKNQIASLEGKISQHKMSEKVYKKMLMSSEEYSNPRIQKQNRSQSRYSKHHFSRESYNSSRESNQNSERSYHLSKESSHRKNHSYKSKLHGSKNDNQLKGWNSKEEKKRKLSEEERKCLLREMQENAVWREEQRKRNTQRYKEEEKREEQSNRMDSSVFLKPMLSKAAGKGSLENRIKQKIFTIQRGSRDMDKHFAKRD